MASGEGFTHYDLGRLRRGATIEVTLSGSAANVQLLDSASLASFRRGAQYRYFGGLARASPVHLVVPSDGHWHVTVDLRGLRGTARSTLRVLPEPLPPLRHVEPGLSEIAVNAAATGPRVDQRTYDVFISHATEDKGEFVRPLARALRDRGLQVWFDEFELRVGQSIRRSIDHGLASSRFGVVVLSPYFFSKNWSQYELDGLVSREMTGEQILLPIWHRLSKEDLLSYSPSLADKYALSTTDLTSDEIANQIAAVVQSA